MKIAGIASVLLGLYSFTLPNTPPQNVGKEVTAGEVLGLKTLRLMKERSFFVFVFCSLLISIPLAFYYNFTNLFLNDLGGRERLRSRVLDRCRKSASWS